jgi:hypothetical protein
MKYLKILGLAVVAAMAMMAFIGAGTASATGGVVCSTATNPCTSQWPTGTTLDASLVGSAKLTAEGVTLDTCTGGTVHGPLDQGSATTMARWTVSTLDWSNCTVTTTTTEGGTLDVTGLAGGSGTVYATGFKVTTNTSFFGSCVWTAGTKKHMGTLTEGVGTAVKLKINVSVERVSGVCPSTANWEAEYVLTSPSNTTMYVSAS